MSCVTSLTATAPAGAADWMRAALLGVAPTTALRSGRSVEPISVTSTRPVWIPTRACTGIPCSALAADATSSRAATMSSPVKVAWRASSSRAAGKPK